MYPLKRNLLVLKYYSLATNGWPNGYYTIFTLKWSSIGSQSIFLAEIMCNYLQLLHLLIWMATAEGTMDFLFQVYHTMILRVFIYCLPCTENPNCTILQLIESWS